MSGVQIVVFSLNKRYSCFYRRRNLIVLIQLLSVFYQNFLSCFQTHRKGVHLPPCIFVIQYLDKLSIYDFTDLFCKNVTHQLVPSYILYGLQYGIYSPHIVYCIYLPIDVRFFPFFIQLQKCRIISYFGSITLYFLRS